MKRTRPRLSPNIVMSAVTLAALCSTSNAQSSASAFKAETPVVAPASAAGRNTVVGLPYSTQWINEEVGAYLYLTYNTASLSAGNELIDGHFIVSFDDQLVKFPTIDYFSKIVAFAPAESLSPLRDVSLWGRYSLGLAAKQGHLGDTRSSIDSTLETSSLFVVAARIGMGVGYERIKGFKPYFGLELSPYMFRQTADLSGAERQGVAYCWAPTLGAHFPIAFDGRGSALLEYRYNQLITAGDRQLFSAGSEVSAGLGVTF